MEKNLEPPIAQLLIEANINLIITELIYSKILPEYKETEQKEFLRFIANNSCKLSLLNIGSLLSKEKADPTKNEMSLLILGTDPEIEDIRKYYTDNGLEIVRHKGIAHIDIGHDNPAGSLTNFTRDDHIMKMRILIDKMTSYFEKKYKWDISGGGAGLDILEGLTKILKTI